MESTSADDDYEARTALRKRIAAEWQKGDPLPRISYTPDEHALWETVTSKLSALHRDLACSNYLRAAARIVLPTDRVPQLDEVSEVLTETCGFRLYPAEGVVAARKFYGEFEDNGFFATQYLRSPRAPFHSPEPDVIHELVGHAVMLADPVFADLYRAFGRAARRARTKEALDAVCRVFWFTIETGVIREQGELRAYGAAILSSVAELESFRHVELRDFDVADVIRQDYSDKECQPLLFVADSVTRLSNDVRQFLDNVK
ncbi:phenylalanine 4-monooxygenase [Streptomyces hygroscopicus]|uniref:phenylalanine 4-monooxygenase n=1 Tax=Streptomyces hygroscopicus TaxID=1912 RepID=UPI00223F6354|nr:phenylalanine 4-monooxygenase [Streptomyces hygroscopicus]